MKPCILFRRGVDDEDAPDYEAALQVFGPESVTQFRTEVPLGSLVVGRFSVLPFYRELDMDLRSRHSRLVNSFRQHHYASRLRISLEGDR